MYRARALAGPPAHGSVTRPAHAEVGCGLTARGEWVHGPGADAVLLYLHGSGYAVCSARTHRGYPRGCPG